MVEVGWVETGVPEEGDRTTPTRDIGSAQCPWTPWVNGLETRSPGRVTRPCVTSRRRVTWATYHCGRRIDVPFRPCQTSRVPRVEGRGGGCLVRSERPPSLLHFPRPVGTVSEIGSSPVEPPLQHLCPRGRVRIVGKHVYVPSLVVTTRRDVTSVGSGTGLSSLLRDSR